ncbi:hypothetical protein C8R45DRAFT_927024 [Mycena sanguinolenta]|nr:hypothetical protein C8R45DRAFT_927024 [Mycena sanguinolenta]
MPDEPPGGARWLHCIFSLLFGAELQPLRAPLQKTTWLINNHLSKYSVEAVAVLRTKTIEEPVVSEIISGFSDSLRSRGRLSDYAEVICLAVASKLGSGTIAKLATLLINFLEILLLEHATEAAEGLVATLSAPPKG